jgi:hypothetical protein
LGTPRIARRAKMFVISKEHTSLAAAERMRLLQYRFEHRRTVAGRGIDDLQDLGCRSLPLQRLIALSCALGKLTLQIGDELLGIG